MKNRLKAFILNIQRKLQRLFQRLNEPLSGNHHPLIYTIPPILIRITAIVLATAVIYKVVELVIH